MRTQAIAATFVLVLAACSHPPSRRTKREPETPPGTLVTVNGVAITEADLELRSRPRSHESEGESEDKAPSLTLAQKKAVLETIVRQELEAQRAVELGLDRDETYRTDLAKLQASIDAFRRQRLGDLYQRHEREATKVSDDEARRYFQQNEEKLQTELHVFQILMRDRARIDTAHRAIESGTPFEEVAAAQFPSLPAGTRSPWDLGFLRYNQIPEPWRGVVDRLEDGKTSAVIAGPRNRFWIVKVVERRRNASLGFDAWRANVIAMLQEERLTARRAQTERSLRQKAKIRHIRDPQP